MSQTLAINNREFIPAGDVGRHFGYTRDYILTLAREGKIEGQKVGHRWYVNLDSARDFFETAKATREERLHQISEVRKAELLSFEQNRAPLKRGSTAILETLAILVLGLMLGVTGFVGTTTEQKASLSSLDSGFLKEFALSFYELISPTSFEAPPEETHEILAVSPSTSTASEAPVATTTHTSLVIGDGQVLTTTTIQSIRDSFSDDVSVSIDPHNPDSGVIIPHFKNNDGEAYRFLMVPVDVATP